MGFSLQRGQRAKKRASIFGLFTLSFLFAAPFQIQSPCTGASRCVKRSKARHTVVFPVRGGHYHFAHSPSAGRCPERLLRLSSVEHSVCLP
eukprot:scaffold21410_cov39-Phaeocystis_antarctica.AAC.2